jgi:ribosomal-protein-serine acetyltransferase
VLRLPLSDRCHLRFLEESDADELYAAIDANRAYLAPWLPWAERETPQDALEFIRLTRRQIAENNGFQTGIVCDGHIIGVVGFHGVQWDHGSTSLGYWLVADQQGGGIMTSAVRALVDHAFGTWNLNRVEIQAAVDNVRSRAIPERLGFTEEGIRRAAERIGERYLDMVVYSVLASEWTSAELPPTAS